MTAPQNASQLRAQADKLLDDMIAMQKRHDREIAAADRAWRSAEELATRVEIEEALLNLDGPAS